MNRGTMTACFLTAVLWTIHLSVGKSAFLLNVDSWTAKAALHHFFHVNLFHLSVNTVSVWLLYGRRNQSGIPELLTAWVTASLSYVAAVRSAIGFSDMLYSVCGMRFTAAFPNWRKDIRAWTFIAALAAFCIIPGTSSTTHLLSFMLSLLVSRAAKKIKETTDDCRRASHR